MKWSLVAPFLTADESVWLHDLMGPSSHQVQPVLRDTPEESWHTKKRASSGIADWKQYGSVARRALRSDSGGVITVFPQLALCAALEQRAFRSDKKLVAWFFNTESESQVRNQLAGRALQNVDAFVVHTSEEAEYYPRAFGLDPAKFSFCHLHYGGPRSIAAEEQDDPFVFATGSGFRDYGTFFAAMGKLGYPAKVLAGPRILAGLQPPPNVEILDQIPKGEIHHLVRRARVNVLPLTTQGVCAGGVTIVETFQHGRALVATDRRGGEDYLLDGENCLTAPPYSVDLLAERIEALWTNAELRNSLNEGALKFARSYCTDEAAASVLKLVLDRVSGAGD